MSPERWQEVEVIFEAALELPETERAAFVAARCGEDDALRRSVTEALRAFDSGGSELDSAVGREAAAIVAELDGRARDSMVGAYRIERLLGRGGMGEVYLAQDTRLGRPVALKFLAAAVTADPMRLERFRLEARTASALNHPNIVTIYEVGDDGGQHFIATEFVEGCTLRETLSNGPLPCARSLEIATQAAAALDAAHRAGIVHRDIKPENLMIRPDGLVKVLDFGLAKLVAARPGGSAATALTSAGMILGTAGYLSPEQARGEEVDARSDLFSLGVVLYEMLSGSTPFARGTAIETLAALLEREAPRLDGREGIPAEAAAIVKRLLAKDGAQRYASAAELLDALRAAAAPRAPQRISRRVAIGATVAAAAGAVAGAGWWQSRTPPLRLDRMTVRWLAVPPDLLFAMLHPDGKQVLLVRDDVSRRSYWVGPVDDLTQARQLRKWPDREFWGAGFAPHEPYVYLTTEDRQRRTGGTLTRVPLGDGEERVVLNNIATSPLFRPDGGRIAFAGFQEPGQATLCTAAPDGSDRRVLGAGPVAYDYRWPAWSTDGRTILYTTGENASGRPRWRLMEIDADGKARRELLPPQNAEITRTVCLDRRLFAFVMEDGETGRSQIYVSAPGGPPQRLTHDVNDYYLLQTNTAGRLLLATLWKRESGLWLAGVPEHAGPEAETLTARRLTIDGTDSNAPAWKHDGGFLFHALTRGKTELWAANADGGDARPLLPAPVASRKPAVSADGQWIVYSASVGGLDQIWRARSDGSEATRLTEGPDHTQPRLSPDGQWVYYASQAHGTWAAYRCPLAGGPSELFLREMEVPPTFSPDGTWMFYPVLDPVDKRTKMVIRRTHDTAGVQYIEGVSTKTFQFTPDSRFVIYAAPGDGFSWIWQRPVEGGEARKIYRIDVPGIEYLRLSGDGRRIVFTTYRRTAEAVIFENFR